MNQNSETLDKWRKFFQMSDSNIFDIIEYATMVAAMDYPQIFRLKREKIIEALFSCPLAKCDGCDRIQLSAVELGGSQVGCKYDLERKNGVFGDGVNNDSKANSNRADHEEFNVKQVSNFSFDDANALSDEIEKDNQIIGDVLAIKKILENEHEESESLLFDSLRRLELMDLSMHKLEATKIGKTVNLLRKHKSKKVQVLSKTLVRNWKSIANEWLSTTEAIAAPSDTPEPVKPAGLEEHGLPSPPLDEGALFIGQSVGLDFSKFEFSKFFDSIDDNGNVNPMEDNTGNDPKKHKPNMKQQAADTKLTPANIGRSRNKPTNIKHGTGRQLRTKVDQKSSDGAKIQQKTEKESIQKRPIAYTEEKPKSVDHATKSEDTKKRLCKDHHPVQNDKRQRTIQDTNSNDIPRQVLGQRYAHIKPASLARPSAVRYGRR